MAYSTVFFGLLLLLFLSSQLTSQAITDLFRRLVRSHGISIRLLALVYLPGVVLHELSHAVMAMLLFVPVGKMEFMPEVAGDHVKLGSVQVGKTDPVRRMLIGLAPVLVGCVVLFVTLFYFLPRDLVSVTDNIWQSIIVLYAIFAIGNTMFSSRKDLEGTVGFLLAFGIVAVALFFVGIRIPEQVVGYFRSSSVQEVFRMGSVFLAVPLMTNGVVLVVVRVFLGIR